MNFVPGYIKLNKAGILAERVRKAEEQLRECFLCPHECGTDRRIGAGVCRATDKVKVASYGPHFGEESVLVGRKGSGTIFFAHCNLRCVFCQNHHISQSGSGTEITNEKLADIMLLLQDYYQCHNINLVTPTHYTAQILAATKIAIEKGLHLPLVYNCGGYEKIETLQLLDGVVDIYMPDFKYFSREKSKRYSDAENYPTKAMEALKEMDRQVGPLKLDGEGLARRGLLVRHLMLPAGLEETKKILQFIKNELSVGVLVNLMGQYYPAHKAYAYNELRTKLGLKEYRRAYTFAKKLDLWLD